MYRPTLPLLRMGLASGSHLGSLGPSDFGEGRAQGPYGVSEDDWLESVRESHALSPPFRAAQ